MSVSELPIEGIDRTALSRAGNARERIEAVFAFLTLALVDAVIRVAGFKGFHRLVRRWPTRTRKSRPDAVRSTCLAVERAATYYFKRAWCLQRSATAVCLLRLRGVKALLTIGVRKFPFQAHAWVEVEGRVVNDSPGVQQEYTVLERC